eukprot:609417-Rhodomonas_salina.3
MRLLNMLVVTSVNDGELQILTLSTLYEADASNQTQMDITLWKGLTTQQVRFAGLDRPNA